MGCFRRSLDRIVDSNGSLAIVVRIASLGRHIERVIGVVNSVLSTRFLLEAGRRATRAEVGLYYGFA
jgi:hypothetical protein